MQAQPMDGSDMVHDNANKSVNPDSAYMDSAVEPKLKDTGSDANTSLEKNGDDPTHQVEPSVDAEPAAAAALPDYVLSPNAVFKDEGAEWRYGAAPDYSKTRKVWEETKQKNHPDGSLEQIVENLVKNWEVEASFKSRLSDWRTIDPENYSFAMNGGPPSSAEDMIKTGTYNGILVANEFYDPKHNDFASSHKTFKRMMPTFAWEVLEVYSGPPTVSFRWRHWGQMKNDYVGFNKKGEKVTIKAHGGPIDIQGVSVATVDEGIRLQSVRTWMDPLEMFRQMAPDGIVNKQPSMTKEEDAPAQTDIPGSDGTSIARDHNEPGQKHEHEPSPEEIMPKHISNVTGKAADEYVPSNAQSSTSTKNEDSSAAPLDSTSTESSSLNQSASNATPSESNESTNDKDNKLTYEVPEVHDKMDEHLEQSADIVHPHPKTTEEAVRPSPGQAVAASANSEETRLTHEEMSHMSAGECPFMMNRE